MPSSLPNESNDAGCAVHIHDEQDPRCRHIDERSSLILLDAPRDEIGAKQTIRNVWWWSLIFSATPSAAIACMSLATARLGSIGAWQSGILYLSYTLSAVLLGATLLSKWLGSRNAMITGMTLYCTYVGCFCVATAFPNVATAVAWTGAAIGGIGAGFLWTAQGVYFAQCAEEYSMQSGSDWAQSTSMVGAIFAFCFLAEEATLDLLSTMLIEFGNVPWTYIFAVYACIAILSTSAMTLVKNYGPATSESHHPNSSSLHSDSVWSKLTIAIQLLLSDSKMKYMIGLNASFGLASAFVNSFVSGVVLPMALHDTNSRFVGLFVAFHASVAAAMSLILGRISQRYGKSPAIVLGALCLGAVAIPFLYQPTIATNYGWSSLLVLYALEGTGRAMFEGPLKAVFADYFGYEKEGAYANIILQNGLSAALAYVLSFTLTCSKPSAYCISYRRDGSGTLHDIGTFSLLVVMTSFMAILGYWRATVLYQRELESGETKMSAYRSESIASYRNSQSHSTSDQQHPPHSLMDRKTYAMLEQIILKEDNDDTKGCVHRTNGLELS